MTHARVWLIALCAVMATVAACGGQADSASVPSVAHKAILRRDIRWLSDSIVLLRFDAPPSYVQWKAEVEKCSGLHRDGWPTFFVAPVFPLPALRLGFYVWQSQTVVFALGAEREAWVVRHELLHWLLDPKWAPKDDEHPKAYFGLGTDFGKCGDLVNP